MISTEPIAFGLIPPLLFVGSGIVGLRRPPSGWLRSGILHLASGVVFAVVAVELIPDLLRDHRPIETVLGFTIGVAAMLGLRSLSPGEDEEDPQGAPSGSTARTSLPGSMLTAIGIDLGVDGFMIGIGFAAGAKEGRLLALALGVELASLGFAVAASASKIGVPLGRSVQALGMLASTFVVGAFLGTTVLSNLSSRWLAGVLSFGSAALLFLVTEELLSEAHEEKETPALTAMFFVGFLVFLILGIAS